MPRRMTFVAFVMISLGLLAAPATAGFPEDLRLCNMGPADPDTRIAACSRLIGTGQLRGNDLAAAYLERGIAHGAKADYDQAIADDSEAIRLNPRSANAYNNRAFAFNNKGEHDRAIVDASEAIRLDPRFALAYAQRAEAFVGKGDFDRAIADADDAIKLNPTLAIAYAHRGSAFEGKRDPDRAIADCSEAIRLNPNLAVAYGGRGNAYLRKADYERAIADYDQAIRLDPKPALYKDRGNAYLGKADYERAIADFSSAINSDQKSALFYTRRGNAFRLKGDFDRALADLTQAITLNPKFMLAYYDRAIVFNLRDSYDRAIADWSEAIRLAPQPASAYSGRGASSIFKGDYDGAIRDLDEAIRLDPKLANAFNNRGYAYLLKGDIDRAFADLNEAVRLDSRDMPAHAFRGLAFERKGDRENAIADFKVALSLASDRFFAIGLRAQAIAKERLAALTATQATVPQTIPASSARQGPSLADVSGAGLLGRRVALVIGNSAYQAVSALPNPKNDATAVAEVFKGAGFAAVQVVTDGSRDGMIRALRAFQDEADKADWAVLYYAGHGLEIGGINYLVPIDAQLKTDRDVQDEAVSLNRVLDAITGAKKVKLVLLDACRDNPFAQQMQRTAASRGVSRGLARIDPEGSTMVVYAAKDGEVAEDGNGEHSPFAAALIHRLQQPGVEINRLFGLITGDVMVATSNHQRPYVYGSIPLIEGQPDQFFRVP